MRRVVPWKTSLEWDFVFEGLYSFGDSVKQREALDQVYVWRAKGMNAVPLSIDCTANLVEALLTKNESAPLATQLSLVTCIVRMVNGFLDAQQKGAFAKSITKLADDLGMPRILVDIRHDGTHGADLPSLSLLKLAADVALSWLKENYWLRQSDVEKHGQISRNKKCSSEWDFEVEAAVCKALDEYKKNIKANEAIETSLNVNLSPLFASDLSDSLFEALFARGCLVPKDVKKCKLLIDHSERSRDYFILWKPLLNYLLSQNSSIIDLIQCFLVQKIASYNEFELNNEEELHVGCLTYWLVEICKNPDWTIDTALADKVNHLISVKCNNFLAKIALFLHGKGVLSLTKRMIGHMTILCETLEKKGEETVLSLERCDKIIEDSEDLLVRRGSGLNDNDNGNNKRVKDQRLPLGFFPSDSIKALDLSPHQIKIFSGVKELSKAWNLNRAKAIFRAPEENTTRGYLGRKKLKLSLFIK